MKLWEAIGLPQAPYQFQLSDERGKEYHARPPFPDLSVIGNDVVHVREIKWQRLTVRASVPEDGKTEDVQVMRLVAVLEGGEEVEMSRLTLPAEVCERPPADPGKCASCGLSIPLGSGFQIEGEWYHRGCLR